MLITVNLRDWEECGERGVIATSESVQGPRIIPIKAVSKMLNFRKFVSDKILANYSGLELAVWTFFQLLVRTLRNCHFFVPKLSELPPRTVLWCPEAVKILYGSPLCPGTTTDVPHFGLILFGLEHAMWPDSQNLPKSVRIGLRPWGVLSGVLQCTVNFLRQRKSGQ